MPLYKLQEVRKQKLEECNRAKKEKIMSATKESKKKIMTYADWDKFDADKECEKVDEKSDSSSESLLEDLKDQALIEKEVVSILHGQISRVILMYNINYKI